MALERLARPDVKALYLMPNGHNPTGRSISVERRRALVAWSHASGIPLIEDDYGAALTLERRNELPHLRALSSDVIYVSTISKLLIPALRHGNNLCPPPLRADIRSLKRLIDLGSSAMQQ